MSKLGDKIKGLGRVKYVSPEARSRMGYPDKIAVNDPEPKRNKGLRAIKNLVERGEDFLDRRLSAINNAFDRHEAKASEKRKKNYGNISSDGIVGSDTLEKQYNEDHPAR